MNALQASDMIRSMSEQFPGHELDWLHGIRSEALDALLQTGFPHTKLEDWKYTEIKQIAKYDYALQLGSCIGLVPEDIEHLFIGSDEACRIVFVNGRYTPQLSAIKHDDSLFELDSLANALAAYPEVLQPYLAHCADTSAHGFNALNTASIRDGLYLHIHENVQLTEPIHVLYLTSASDGLLVLPRNLVLLDAGASAVLVEHYASIGHANMLVDAVSETQLAPGAVLDHIKLLQESDNTVHIASHAVVQKRSSNFNSYVISTGGSLIRSDTHTRLADEHAACHLSGLYLAGDAQHMDFHTFIEHASPLCSSRQDYRGILRDRARGVFNGRVYVRENAQQTDAHQSNKTLLLSERAEMDTKPQLEIYADDVTCSHSATVGQLDEDMLFYLRSRGLSEAAARSILVKGFVSGVLQGIQHGGVRDKIIQLVDKDLSLETADEVVMQ